MWDEFSVGRRRTTQRRALHHDDPADASGAVRDSLGRHISIERLPDDLLLEIFDHHRLAAPDYSLLGPWEWHRLAHVCKRWRHVIFGSPHRLHLRLVYTYRKPVRHTLDCWPALPLSIWYPRALLYDTLSLADEENVISALEHPGRIREINLTLTRPLSERLAPLMQAPFPVLEHLQLGSREMVESLILPSGFLGESTPRLRRINLDGTPFPSLPRLLVTAVDLVSLRLYEIPNTGYFSPESLVTGLDATPRLRFLEICFVHPTPLSDQTIPDTYPQTRVALPDLTEFQFRGDNEYLEDLIARIDAPNIEQFNVTLFDRPTFELPQLAEFIGRTEELMSSPQRMSIWLWAPRFSITHYFGSLPSPRATFQLQMPCSEFARQLTLLARICRQLSRLVACVERLDIEANSTLSDWRDEIDDELWLGLLAPFSGVRRLELIGSLIPHVASALEQSAGDMPEGHGGGVLPSLRDLHLRGTLFSPSLESFVATRQLSGSVISIRYTEDEDHDP